MSKNKKQSAKTAAKTTAKAVETEAEQIKGSIENVKESLKETIDKQEKPAAPAADKKTAAKAADKPAQKSAAKPAAKATVKQTTPSKTAEAKKPMDKNPTEKTTEKPTQKPAVKPTAKPEPTKTNPPSNQPKPAPAAKKSGGAGVMLALLLGLAGTGLGAYSFNELRTLKAANAANDSAAKFAAIEEKLKGVEKLDANAAKQQISELLSQVNALKASETGFNERMAKIEQAQDGVVKNITSTVEQQLAAMGETVKAVQDKVDDVQMGQQGLVKNMNEVTAGQDAMLADGMAKQEVAYLVRMADLKLTNERDVAGATGLLQMAADRLLAANKGQTTADVDAIRAKIVQLQGAKTVDENALLGQLADVSRDIPQLVVKSAKPAANNSEAKQSAPESTFDKLTSVLTSGVKYTPKDPDQVNVTAETVLIEKRLMQADVKTAEFAVRSHNKTLLSESFRSIRDKLAANFADNETAQKIKTTLAAIEKAELSEALPSVSGLVEQLEQAQ